LSGIGVLILLGTLISRLITNSSSAKAKRAEKLYQSLLESVRQAIDQTIDPTKEEILQNYHACLILNKKFDDAKDIIEALKKKKKKPKIDEQIERCEAELSELTTELEKVQLDADKDLDDIQKCQYSSLCDLFENILSCEKIWIITYSIRNTELKSSAARTEGRKNISFDVGIFNYIKSSFNTPMLRDLDGNTYYIYPRYIIKAQSSIDFEVFPVNDIGFGYLKQRYIEEEGLPEDAHVADYTWKYVNKNGDPDKRYSYNPRLPVAEYGKIEIEKFGLTYCISNYIAADSFAHKYNSYISTLPEEMKYK
jgi:hypothetical protein